MGSVFVRPQSALETIHRYRNEQNVYFQDIHIDFSPHLELNGSKLWSNKPNLQKRISKTTKCTEHFIIFDWDDTIFFTSWLRHGKYQYYNEHIRKCIKNIGQQLYHLFLKLIAFYGSQNIKIVTSAMKEWVMLCMKNIDHVITDAFHDFCQLIIDHDIQIISARDEYLESIHDVAADQNKYTESDSLMWKQYIFDKIVSKRFGCGISGRSRLCCLSSIGDSFAEYIAAQTSFVDLGNIEENESKYLYRIKLMSDSNYSLEQFYSQLQKIDALLMENIELFANKTAINSKNDCVIQIKSPPKTKFENEPKSKFKPMVIWFVVIWFVYIISLSF